MNICFFKGKDWDDIIPEEERKKITEEEIQRELMALNLPPRQRKQVTKVWRLLLLIVDHVKCITALFRPQTFDLLVLRRDDEVKKILKYAFDI